MHSTSLKTQFKAQEQSTKQQYDTQLRKLDINQMLIQTNTGKIQFSTGVNYHEIDPVTFMEQLKWNSQTSTSEITNSLVSNSTRLSNLKQADFTLPTGYQPGS